MKNLRLLLFLLLCIPAYGQIDVPAESEPYTPIVATVKVDIPEGATFTGGWTSDESVKFIEVAKNAIHIWAPPGVHPLNYSGKWTHLEVITFKDGDGNMITLHNYLGSDEVHESIQFTIKGAAPDPPDPTPPQPSPIAEDGLRVLIVRESNTPLGLKQQALINSTQWKTRLGKGHWMVLDPDQQFQTSSIWKDAMEATKDQGVPRVIVSNRPKGAYVGPLPQDLEALNKLIDEWDR